MPWDGVELAFLENYTKNKQTGIIVDKIVEKTPVLDALKECSNSEDFYGEYAEILMEMNPPDTAQAMREGGSYPDGQHWDNEKMFVPVKQMVAVAAITKRAMRRAKGGETAWGRAQDRAEQYVIRDMARLANLAALGDGSGKLARVASCSQSTFTSTVTCDNTYLDFGWDNTIELRVGQYVDVYQANGTTARTLGALVTAVAPGKRVATSGTPWAATTGTVTLTTVDSAPGIASDDVIYKAGTKPTGQSFGTNDYWLEVGGGLPYGLNGLISDGYIFGDLCEQRYFQRKDRRDSKFSTLCAHLYGAVDGTGATHTRNVKGFGYSSETPAEGVPTYWQLSNIFDVLMDIMDGDGAGEVTDGFAHPYLLACMARKSKSDGKVFVQTTDITKVMTVVGGEIATAMQGPEGNLIKLHPIKDMSPHVLQLVSKEDIEWWNDVPFGWAKDDGNIWHVERNAKTQNFEAEQEASYQIGANRCDNMACMFDMRYDI